MDAVSYKTKHLNKATVKKDWILVDAENQVVGRLASKIAYILRGKHKTSFSEHVDCGDNVIIINAEKVRFTGKKLTEKEYIRYTGYPGGQRFATPKEFLSKHPERVLEIAIKGMLPKNRLSSVLNTNVRIFAGTNHGMEAQKPQKIDLDKIK
ncbi:MAG: 50S ribosomal protein L13 [Bacteroidetes bacterium]|nr:50S ribosomal protein L13 [Bacteroidota bacterium]